MKNIVKNTDMPEHNKMVKLYENASKLRRSKPTLTLEMSEKVLEIANRLNDNTYRYLAMHMIGVVQTMLGKSEKALQMLQAAIKIARVDLSKNKELLSRTLNAMSLVHSKMGNEELQLDCLLRSLQLDKNNKYAQGNLARLYFNMKKYNKALESWQHLLDMCYDEESIPIKVNAMQNMSHAYTLMGELQKSKKVLLELQGLIPQLPPEKTDEELTAFVLSGLGVVHGELGDMNKALDYFSEALLIAELASFMQVCCETLSCMAELYFKNDDEINGLSATQRALRYSTGQSLKEQRREILNNIIEYYEQKNETQKAYPYLKQLNQLSKEQLTASRDKNLQKIIVEREKEISLLEEKNKEIQGQNTILKQFAHIISHDLREPIRGITGFAGMLNNKYSESLDKTGNEYLQFILSEAHSMNRNLARLLEYATIEKSVDKVKEIDLQQIITKIQQQYQDESFQIDITYEGVPMKMQRQHANVLLSELIDNTVQFRKKNEDCHVEIKCELKEGYYRLFVKDYGIGIDAAYHDRIFKIFNKINKWEGTGAGVGLAICERIVQLYKGEISIESIPNQFSTFRIKIAA